MIKAIKRKLLFELLAFWRAEKTHVQKTMTVKLLKADKERNEAKHPHVFIYTPSVTYSSPS